MKTFFTLLLLVALGYAEKYQQIHLEKGVGYAICSGSESYYTADPDDCRNFYGCVYDENIDDFHLYKFHCQDGLAYDIESHSCQDEKTVDRCWYACPEGWDLFQNSCYFFTRQKQDSFAKAKEFCQNKDAYLVEIESKDEDDFVIENALKLATGENDGRDFWIGAEDLDEDGQWTWTTSGKPVIYSNWWIDMGKLNSGCAQLLKNGMTNPRKLDSFYWAQAAGNKDCSKDGDNGVICEKDPDSSLPE